MTKEATDSKGNLIKIGDKVKASVNITISKKAFKNGDYLGVVKNINDSKEELELLNENNKTTIHVKLSEVELD